MEAHGEAVDVEQRQRVDETVRRRPAPGLDRAARLGEEVAMIEEGALGTAGGSRGVYDQRRALGVERRCWRWLVERQLVGRDDSKLPLQEWGPVVVGED